MSADTSAIVRVPLHLVRFDEHQPRRVIDPDELAELKGSMDRLGRTLQHITVTAKDDGTYQLLAGERRVRAAQALGWHWLPAVVVDEVHHEDPVRLLSQVAENAARAPLRPHELCDVMARLRSQIPPTDIAESAGISVRTVYNYLSVIEHPDLVEALREGRSLRAVLAEVASRQKATSGRPTPPNGRSSRRAERAVRTVIDEWSRLDDHQRAALAAELKPLLETPPDGSGPPPSVEGTTAEVHPGSVGPP